MHCNSVLLARFRGAYLLSGADAGPMVRSSILMVGGKSEGDAEHSEGSQYADCIREAG